MEHRPDRVTLINGLLDFILLNVRLNVDKLEHCKVVPAPDLIKKLNFNLFLTTLTASLTATQGTLSDLTTIKRVGDVTVTSQGNTLYVTAPIAMDILRLTFHHYTLQVSMIKKSGDKLQLNIKKTYFDAFIVLQFDGLDCSIFFEKFTMLEFNDIDVNITGFSFLNPIARRIAEWIVDYFNNFVVKEVAEEYTRNLLNLALSDKRTLQKLVSYAITGMVAEPNTDKSESDGSVAVDNLQLSRSVDVHPVAPLRQRRNNSSHGSERRNNQSSSNHSREERRNYSPSSPSQQVPRPNNTQPQHSEPRLHMNGSAGSRLPEGSLRNNLTGRRNEIIIQPNKLFSTKSSDAVEVNYIPLKPPML